MNEEQLKAIFAFVMVVILKICTGIVTFGLVVWAALNLWDYISFTFSEYPKISTLCLCLTILLAPPKLKNVLKRLSNKEVKKNEN